LLQLLPTLITTSSTAVPQSAQGVLGLNTTSILFGNSTLSAQQQSGVRLLAGWWLDDCRLCGIEVGGFYLGRASNNFTVDSATTPVIGRPAQVQNLGNVESRQLTASPSQGPGTFNQIGNVAINNFTEFWGAEANARGKLWCGCNYRIDGIIGFRYLDLREGLQITENTRTLVNLGQAFNPNVPIFAGDSFLSRDRFTTRNQFYGGQVGVDGEYRFGRWIVGGGVKVALGEVHQTIDVQGNTTLFRFNPANGGPLTVPGGLYAQSTNFGNHTRDRFAVAPEVGIRVGYQVTDNIQAFVGYNFIYLSNVVRPGDQIDRSLDILKVPFAVGNPPTFTQANGQTVPVPPVAGASHPVVLFRETDFWAQGLTVGVEIRY
jgi:hypothetical protein